jgi:hypothetical protein
VRKASQRANILSIQKSVLEARHVERIEAKLDRIEAELMKDDDSRPLLEGGTFRRFPRRRQF